MKPHVLCSALLVAALGVPARARAAEGVALAPTALSATARARLERDVKALRVAKPAAFQRVQAVRDRVAELDRRRRGRLAPVGVLLHGLGKDALLPMLEMLALDAQPRGTLTDTAWTALHAGLIEAVGALRAPEAEPVLRAILDGSATDSTVVRAAAEALGRLGSDRVATKLIALAATDGPKQRAVLAGMGECRRAVIADALADALAGATDAATAKLLVRSLGTVGNSFAWQTPAVRAHADEEDRTRARAAEALLGAFIAWDGEVRQAAVSALLLVDDAATPSLVAAARAGASGELAQALDELALRLGKNPLHR